VIVGLVHGVSLLLAVGWAERAPYARYGLAARNRNAAQMVRCTVAWFAGGDLVDADIASFTKAAAEQTGIAHPVDQAVTELGKSRVIRVYVSYPSHLS
jgi:hypothetical protein